MTLCYLQATAWDVWAPKTFAPPARLIGHITMNGSGRYEAISHDQAHYLGEFATFVGARDAILATMSDASSRIEPTIAAVGSDSTVRGTLNGSGDYAYSSPVAAGTINEDTLVAV